MKRIESVPSMLHTSERITEGIHKSTTNVKKICACVSIFISHKRKCRL